MSMKRAPIALRPQRGSLAAAIIAIAALGACGRAGTLGPTDPPLAGRTFLSRAMTGHDLVPGTEIRLSFNDGDLGATAGCNSLGAPYSLEGTILVIDADGMAMTEIGCDPERHAQDEWLAEFLMSSPTFDLSGDDLTLSGGTVTIRLLDVEVADPDRPLIGTTWSIDTVITGDAASSVPDDGEVTLDFPDDASFTATAGACTSVRGPMTVGAGTLSFGDFAADDVACPTPWAETLEVLRAGETTYEIDAARLTIEAGEIGISATAESE